MLSLKKTTLFIGIYITFSIVQLHSEIITQYNDVNSFVNALGNSEIIVENFTNTSHFPISTGVLNQFTNLPGIQLLPGDIQPGVTYSTTIGTGNFFNIDAGANFNGGFLDTIFPDFDLTIDFDETTTAFGFDTNNFIGTDFDLTIQFADSPDFVQNFSVANLGTPLQFFGFQSDKTDIRSLVVSGNGSNSGIGFAIDNFTFAVIPEPSSYALFGILIITVTTVSSFRSKKRIQK